MATDSDKGGKSMRWKDLTIGQKNGIGFGLVIVLLIIIAFVSYSGIGNILTNAERVIKGNQLDGQLAQREVDHLNWVNKVNALLTDESVTELAVETDHKKCKFGQSIYGEERKEAVALVSSLEPIYMEIEAPHQKLHESAIDIQKNFRQSNIKIPGILASKISDHLKWAMAVQGAITGEKNSLDVETDPQKCALGKWLISDEAQKIYHTGSPELKKEWDAMLQSHETLHHSATKIQANMADKAIYFQETIPALEETLGHLEKLKSYVENDLSGMEKANKIYATETLPSLKRVQDLLQSLRTEAKINTITDEEMLKAAKNTKRNLTILCMIAVILGIFLSVMISKGIVAILKAVSDQMNDSSEQVSTAADQVSGTSQLLAEGASEQAASIEETSSSLEEMSSMTKQNASNASQADALMIQTHQVVSKANDSMTKLTKSMADITQASEETSKIIKTIDEIAFQTNLLALNAAVEAARAGEAGAGFAVVADEVRNLAMRAAQAAKNTAGLIEGTVKKINEGADLVKTTNEAFVEVAESSAKIGNLINEIASASKEQAEGINQVNKAVTEMDQVTQQNAANAEESASAAEEMSAQAKQMKEHVIDMMKLVGGNTNTATNARVRSSKSHIAYRNKPAIKQKNPKQIVHYKKQDDEDFSDF
ncbi:MAG: CZB domain-containing protein [Proteobacteria bacterium]|nr:CZB domain-containing protein [Pseudomonadota bacterium]